MPSESSAWSMWEQSSTALRSRGQLFADLVLADEISNRRRQDAVGAQQAMKERQVTVDGERHALPVCHGDRDAKCGRGRGHGSASRGETSTFPPEGRRAVTPPPPPGAGEELGSCGRLRERASTPSARGTFAFAAGRDAWTRSSPRGVRSTPGSSKRASFAFTPRRPSAHGAGRPALTLGASPRSAVALFKCARTAAAFAGRELSHSDRRQGDGPRVLRHR